MKIATLLVAAVMSASVSNAATYTLVATIDNATGFDDQVNTLALVTGDIIVIPAGIQVDVQSSVTINPRITIRISGTLFLSQGNNDLTLTNAASTILLLSTGAVVDGNSSSSHILIGGNIVYNTPDHVTGPGVFTTVGFVGGMPLPVVLKYFTASVADGIVALDFETISEAGISHYEVERSTDGVVFSSMALRSQSRNLSGSKYRLKDAAPTAGKSFYRLGIYENDGSKNYSSTVTVFVKGTMHSDVQVYPNPAQDVIYISGGLPSHSFCIIDMSGHVSAKGIVQPHAAQSVDVSALPAGRYYVQVGSEDGSLMSLPFIKLATP